MEPRRATRIYSFAPQPPAAHMTSDPIDSAALPPAFLERLERIVPAGHLESCRRAFIAVAPTAFRVNGLLAEPAGVVEELESVGIHPSPLSWRADAYTVAPEARRSLTETAACREGRLYIQNPSSMVPPEVLGPVPGEWILDLAAAPGGKTLHLAALMGNRGRISAVEPGRSRFFRLQRNLEAGGVTCAQLYQRDGVGVGRTCPEWFDRVLLDAPCSAEGRMRGDDPETFRFWSPRRIKEMSRLQRRLLLSGLRSVKVGGVLVYSTCTFAPEENEMIINRALGRHGHAVAVEAVDLPLANAVAGLTAWGGRDLDPALEGTVRILPDGLMEGFYVARLRKTGSIEDD